jgi:REP element-mobilizing transposase RayT
MLHKHLPKFSNEGHAHFVTSKTHLNTPLFKNPLCARIVLEELAFYRREKGFKVLGYVAMPDHFHGVIWWDVANRPELSISKIMQGFKGSVARRIIDELFECNAQRASMKHPLHDHHQDSLEYQLKASLQRLMLSATHVSAGGVEHSLRDLGNADHRRGLKYKIWQTGFYDFNIYSPEKLNQKLKYIHNNPVKAGLCVESEEYPFSSAWYYAEMKQPNGLNEILCPVDGL